jgi:hypothetical protein
MTKSFFKNLEIDLRFFFEYHGIKNLFLYRSLKGKYTLEELKEYFYGKTVALIGNAQSIFDFKFGSDIDSHDIVIRINNGYVKTPESQGTKTTVISSGFNKVSKEEIESNFNPEMVIWTGTKDSLLYGEKYINEKVFLEPYSLWRKLKKQISTKKTVAPTSGIQIIDLVCNYLKPARVDIYGFDFLKSDTINEKKTIRYIAVKRHDFNKESQMVMELVKNNDFINIHGIDSSLSEKQGS